MLVCEVRVNHNEKI